MHFTIVSAAILALASFAQAAALQPRDLLQDLQNQALANLKAAESSNPIAKRSCSVFNASARRDW
jgi:tyrosinase